MSRADHRGGRAPIRTADELANLLPVPIYLLVAGWATSAFPTTDRSGPSTVVGILPNTRGSYNWADSGRGKDTDFVKDMAAVLPVWIHWTQWRDVVVPVVEDPRVISWQGKIKRLGDLLTLPVTVYGPDNEVAEAILDGDTEPTPLVSGTEIGRSAITTVVPSNLFVGHLRDYIELMTGIIKAQAVSAGY